MGRLGVLALTQLGRQGVARTSTPVMTLPSGSMPWMFPMACHGHRSVSLVGRLCKRVTKQVFLANKLTWRKEGTVTCLFIAYACIVFRLIVRVSNVHKADFVGAGVSSAQHIDLTAQI